MHRTATHPVRRDSARQIVRAGIAAGATLVLAVAVLATFAPAVSAAEPAVPLGTADPFAVLGGQSVTNTGPTVLTGDLGVAPGTAISGFPPGLVNGTVHATDAVALQAQSDLTTAYNDAAQRALTASITSDLGGLTLPTGVYNAASSAQLTGTLTLDGENDAAATFIFQIGSTLTTASNSSIALINGAQACNVFWQVGSSATLGTSTDFIGTIMALTSVTLNTDAGLTGRALARNGSVTLDSNVITTPACAPPTTSIPPSSTTTSASTSTSTSTTTNTATATTTRSSAVVTGTPTSTSSTLTDSATPTTTTPPPVSSARTTATTTSLVSRSENSTARESSSSAMPSPWPSAADTSSEANGSASTSTIGANGAGGATGTTPLAATGPRPILPLLITGALLLAAGALLLAAVRNHTRPRRHL